MKKKDKIWFMLGLGVVSLLYVVTGFVQLIPNTTEWFGLLDEYIAGAIGCFAFSEAFRRK